MVLVEAIRQPRRSFVHVPIPHIFAHHLPTFFPHGLPNVSLSLSLSVSLCLSLLSGHPSSSFYDFLSFAATKR